MNIEYSLSQTVSKIIFEDFRDKVKASFVKSRDIEEQLKKELDAEKEKNKILVERVTNLEQKNNDLEERISKLEKVIEEQLKVKKEQKDYWEMQGLL